ncbi:alpha-amylase [Aquirufa antheringensis]|uniref:Alpha-amylase n=2 Tax=Aquirufa antheringensis TaxID=2516559 RepID=A0A4Q9BAX2_9BACT|nr:alpha-amylase family glycosyl hydrolase [Aquirufa antheringensis]MCZ2486358.1 alpha-amylase [Aquirufa antheringensis]TBH73269.1 alpha-amylase [Aquirufa antheringensis]
MRKFYLVLLSAFLMYPLMAQKSVKTDKHVVYQMMFHLWGNQNTNVKRNGSAAENGVTKFKDISTKGLQALKKKGYSHLYTTGILEHATMEDFSAFGSPLDHPQVVKGRAGSPFAIKDYYDVNPFLADKPAERMQEFSAMLDRVHQADLKLVLDFVPNHLARVYHSDQKPAGVVDFGQNDNKDLSFSPSNNFYYLPGTQFTIPTGVNPPVPVTVPYIEIPAKVSGNNVFSAQPSIHDWFETVKLNYGVDLQHGNQTHFDPIPDTWLKMTDVLVYWTKKGVDGFRCDMAEMVPVEFWAYAIPKVKALNPEVVFIAEIYNPQEYRNYIFKGGFDYLYDKVGLYDGIRHIMENKPGATTADITRVWQQESGDFANHMLRFLENHDETRLNSRGFAASNFWSTIPGMVLTASMHEGPLMIYFGQEFGEKAQEIEGFNEADDRTTMFDFYRVDTHQRWLNGGKFDGGKLTAAEKEIDSFYSELLAWINSSEVIQKGKFFDLQYAQNAAYPKDKVYAYLRYTDKGRNLIICNFDSVNHDFNIEIPTLAMDMMGIKSYTLKTIKSFVPPTAAAGKVEGNRIQIPSNSAIVISL